MSFIRRLGTPLSLAFLTLFVTGLPASAQTTYEVQGLGFLGTWYGSMYGSCGMGINTSGQAVGESYVTQDSTPGREAFFWDAATGLTGLGDFAGGEHSSTPYAVNDAGQVAGYGRTTAGSKAFVWSQASGLLGLEGFSGSSSAYDINNSGLAVGGGTSARGREAFAWSQSAGLRFLGDFTGGAYNSVAYGINDAGIVVGSGTSASGVQAFVWSEPDGMRGLEMPAGFTDCLASAINNNNPARIAGYCYSATAAESYIWNAASGLIIESLGHLPGGSSKHYARNINDAGQVVGSLDAADGTTSAFLYVPGSAAGMVRLQDLITTPGWMLRDAYGINSSGTIVGMGYDTEGTPQAVILNTAAVCTPAAEVCDDRIDNDCDGLPDCADPDCARNAVCMTTCYENNDCFWPTSGNFCKKSPGDCAGPGSCTEPPPADALCLMAVVCGCDGNMYGTSCMAFRQGINLTIGYGACCQDGDGDGWSTSGGLCGAVDCDDTSAAVHPASVETCDGKDNDCDGLVDEIPPLVSTNQHEFVFQGVRGGPAPAPQTLTISNAGCGSFTWTAAEAAPWLTISQTTGGSGGSTTLGTDTRGLATGVHRVTITISAANDAGLDGSQVAVSLTVAADTTPPTGSLRINNGANSTRSPAVTLHLSAADAGGSGIDAMRFDNGDGSFNSAWERFTLVKAWSLTSGVGTRRVSVQFRDKAGNVSDANPVEAGAQWYEDTIIVTDPILTADTLPTP